MKGFFFVGFFFKDEIHGLEMSNLRKSLLSLCRQTELFQMIGVLVKIQICLFLNTTTEENGVKHGITTLSMLWCEVLTLIHRSFRGDYFLICYWRQGVGEEE